MIWATLIPNVSDIVVIVGIGIFFGMIWVIQQAKSCVGALIDVLLVIAVGVLVIYFLVIVNGYF